jgi:hypothetical protein
LSCLFHSKCNKLCEKVKKVSFFGTLLAKVPKIVFFLVQKEANVVNATPEDVELVGALA